MRRLLILQKTASGYQKTQNSTRDGERGDVGGGQKGWGTRVRSGKE